MFIVPTGCSVLWQNTRAVKEPVWQAGVAQIEIPDSAFALWPVFPAKFHLRHMEQQPFKPPVISV